MDLLQLRYFLEVASQEHMTNAAKKLNVSQPTVSQSILRLETELGIPLFERNGRNIKLNSYGRAVYEPISTAIGLIDGLKTLTDTIKETGEKPITVSYWTNSSMIPRMLSAFSEAYPYIKIRTSNDAKNSDFNFAFETYGSLPQPCQILLQEEIGLAIPHSNPLSQRDSIALSEASGEEFISVSNNLPFRKKTEEFCQLAGFKPKVIIENEDYHTVEHLLNVGGGAISFWPQHSWIVANTPKKYNMVRISSPLCLRTIYMSWPENSTPSRAKDIFRNFCANFFREMKEASEHKW